jgi:ribosome-associated protein
MSPDRAQAEQLLELVHDSLDNDKAIDIVVVDLLGKTSLADFMVIASGSSARQVSAMADHLAEKLKAAGVKGVTIEGAEQADWVLLDGGDVIVHLFRPEVREFYNLEKMWAIPAQEAANAAQPG